MATGIVELLSKGISAPAVSKAFSLIQPSNEQTCSIILNGLTSTNKAYLQILDPIDNSWNNILINGNPVYFDLNNTIIYLGAEGTYRINKLGNDNVGITIQSSKPFNIYQ